MLHKRNGYPTRARILVADWEHVNALTLSAIMERMGYEVATAFSGEEAVQVAACFAPDLLVTEVRMGKISGVEAATQIKAMLPSCKILFLSGDATISDISRSAPASLVYSFTTKPVHPQDLLNSIAYMVSTDDSPGDADVRPAQGQAIEPSTVMRLLANAGFLANESNPGAGSAHRISPAVTFLSTLLQFGTRPETQVS